ncbi:hypothetical protein [Terricaulis sp.]|uniref:hypothetical protein n=1 Tax=Terricaulis sp. TaxID=2768686 RepID=UPI0037833F99
MPADTLTISIPAPLADEVRAAAEARGIFRRLEEPGENVSLDKAFDRFDKKAAAARVHAR